MHAFLVLFRHGHLLAAAGQVGKSVVFSVDADHTITLENVQLSSLAVDDFRVV